MVTGKTSSGFEYSITEGILDDWRYIKAFRNANSKDLEKQVDGVCSVIEVIFNDPEQEEAFYKHIAETFGDEYQGRVPTKVVWTEMNEIIGALRENSETKN